MRNDESFDDEGPVGETPICVTKGEPESDLRYICNDQENQENCTCPICCQIVGPAGDWLPRHQALAHQRLALREGSSLFDLKGRNGQRRVQANPNLFRKRKRPQPDGVFFSHLVSYDYEALVVLIQIHFPH